MESLLVLAAPPRGRTLGAIQVNININGYIVETRGFRTLFLRIPRIGELWAERDSQPRPAGAPWFDRWSDLDGPWHSYNLRLGRCHFLWSSPRAVRRETVTATV